MFFRTSVRPTVCERRCFLSLQLDEEVSISSIDEYVELLYEGVQEKIRGATLIFLLARNPDNLEELVQNGTQVMFLFLFKDITFLFRSEINFIRR